MLFIMYCFFFSSRRRHTRCGRDWSSDVCSSDLWSMVLLIFIQVVLVTMVYGPIAAFLVELFPTRIRYTSMSLPYHIGNGVFGGLTPLIAASLYEASRVSNPPDGDPYVGLLYPIGVAAITLIIG